MLNHIDPTVTDKALIEVATQFALAICKPVADEIGELLADPIRSFRLKNQVKLLNKVKAQLDNCGISPAHVAPRILMPLLDTASWEEDESMIDRWANLLANAANPNSRSNVQIGYVDALKQLSPREALVMDTLYDYYNETVSKGQAPDIEGAQLQTTAGIEEREFETAMDNLFRLNLLTTSGALLANPQLGEKFYSKRSNTSIQFTRFGHSFVSACRPPI